MELKIGREGRVVEAGLPTDGRVCRESEHGLRPVADLIALRRLIRDGQMEKLSRAKRHGEHLGGAVARDGGKRALAPGIHQVLATFRAVEFSDDGGERKREAGGIRGHRGRLKVGFAGELLKGIGAC